MIRINRDVQRPDHIYSGARKPRIARASSQFQNPRKDELQQSDFRDYGKVESEDPTFNSVVVSTNLTLSTFTQHSVLFVGPSGVVSQDNTNFKFTDSTNVLYVANLTVGALSGVLKASAGVVAGSATTSDLPEGSNLYYTDERVDDRVGALLVAGTGIGLSYNDPANTLTISTSITQYTDEMVDDRVAVLIQNGTGISWSYNDGANTLTPTVSLAPFSTSNLAEGSNLYFTDERVDDRVAALLVAGAGIALTYNDGANTLTVASKAVALFDHSANAGNTHSDGTEDDLYADTVAAGQLAANGDKLEAEYGGIFVSSATATREIQIRFAGTSLFDTGAITLSLSSAWTAYVTIIRVSSSVIRYMISLTTEGAALAAYTAVGEVTGLTLANTNILKITGAAAGVGAAANDIVAKLGTIYFNPSA